MIYDHGKLWLEFADGTKLPIKMNPNAMEEAEWAMEQRLKRFIPFGAILEMGGIMPLRVMLWAGIRGADPSKREGENELTQDAAGDLLNLIDHNELAIQLALAIAAAKPHVTEDDLKNAEGGLRAATEAAIQAELKRHGVGESTKMNTSVTASAPANLPLTKRGSTPSGKRTKS